MDLKRLCEVFPENDIEWRPQDAKKTKSGPWIKVLAYVTARAIQARLDDVCGPENWKVDYDHLDGGVKAYLSIRVPREGGDEWVTKADGAPETRVEAFKGGMSSAIKRAASVWGIGRYLYKLPVSFLPRENISEDRRPDWRYIRIDGSDYYWKPPKLPNEFLLEKEQRTEKPEPKKETKPNQKSTFDENIRIKLLKELSELIELGRRDMGKHEFDAEFLNQFKDTIEGFPGIKTCSIETVERMLKWVKDD